MSLVNELKQGTLEQRRERLSYEVRGLLADFLMYDGPEDVAENDSFADLGTDSAQAVEFKFKLEALLSQTIKSTVVFEHPTIAELVDFLLTEYFGAPSPVDALHGKPLETNVTIKQNTQSTQSAIAIIAQAGCFPGASTSDALWQQVENTTQFKLSKASEQHKYNYGAIKCETIRYGSVEFDARIKSICIQFKLAEREASYLVNDRAVVVLLDLLEQALYQSKIDYHYLQQRRVGIFTAQNSSAKAQQPYTLPLANALSYILDVKGPSETFNAFCASTYLALHRASASINAGECELAIVASANFIDSESFNSAASSGLYDDLLDPENCVSSFDAGARGFVRSEGAGIFILGSGQHLPDNASVIAWLLGSAVSHGGRAYSAEAPNATALSYSILECFAHANIDASDVDYIEAHGIGNPLADAVELSTLNECYKALSKDKSKQWWIGSIKPTVGHPEVAAGAAALIKAIYAINNKLLPGIAGLKTPNKEAATKAQLQLAANSKAWQKKDRSSPRVAGLNSYAIGGMTAHILIAEAGIKDQLFINATKRDNSLASYRPTPEVDAAANIDSTSIIQRLEPTAESVLNIRLSEDSLDASPLQLGLDSLAMVNFCHAVNHELNTSIGVGEMLAVNSFAECYRLVARHLSESSRDSHSKDEVVQKQFAAIAQGEAFELSEMQKGLWLIQQSKTSSSSFNVPILFESRKALDIQQLNSALKVVVDEHLSLSAYFSTDLSSDKIQQKIALDLNVSFCTHEFESEVQKKAFLWAELREAFELSNPPLFRAHHIRLSNSNAEYVYFVIHHIVIDGLSGIRFIDEFWTTYKALSSGKTVADLQRCPEFAFLNFIKWEQNYLQSDQGEKDSTWWRQRFSDVEFDSALPYDKVLPNVHSAIEVHCQTLSIDIQRTKALRLLATNHKANLSVVLLAAFGLLLRLVTNKADISVTSPVAGRPRAEFSQGVGCFINLMITRFSIAEGLSFAQLIENLKDIYISAIDHSYYPFAKLGQDLGLGMMKPNQNVLPVSYTYQNIFDGLPQDLLQSMEIHSDFSVYQETDDHYTLEVYDFNDSLELHLKYQNQNFTKETIARHLSYLDNILEQILEQHPEQHSEQSTSVNSNSINLLSYIGESEREFLLNRCGPKLDNKLLAKGVVELFFEKTQKSPNNVAVIDGERTLNYRELAWHVCVLGEELRRSGIARNEIVGIIMPRSIEAIVAMYAVLYAGAAYLPLDPDTPSERLAYIIDESDTKLVLCHSNVSFAPSKIDSKVVTVDSPDLSQATIGYDNCSPVECSDSDLAYVIYTSGSTGKPKGVMIAREALCNLSLHMIEQYEVTQGDRILQFAPLHFDMSVEEIFPYLIAGAAIVLRGEDDIQPHSFAKLIQDHSVSILNIPPAYYDVINLLDYKDKQQLFTQLRVVAFGGEALPEFVMQDVLGFPVRIFNAYGPTEYTVNASIAELKPGQPSSIGHPISGTQYFILDKELNPVPIGVSGELYIFGKGVALGYLKQQELTQKSFIPCPFSEKGLMYKTGDLARWLANGEVEYIGRIDQQVKIRGFRIELGEIENILVNFSGITNAAVVVQNVQGEKILVAFYSAENKIDQDKLHEYLAAHLQSYMRPSQLSQITSLPLTRNGKIDRKKLEKTLLAKKQQSCVAARGHDEAALCEIWAGVLGLKEVGIDNDFFDLGGHSLQAVQIIVRANEALNTNIPLSLFFEMGTIRRLAQAIVKNIPPDSQQKKSIPTLNKFYDNGNIIII